MSSTPKYSSVSVSSEELRAFYEAQAQARYAREMERLQHDLKTLSAELRDAEHADYHRYFNTAALDEVRRAAVSVETSLRDATAANVGNLARTFRRTRRRWTEAREAAETRMVQFLLQERRVRDEAGYQASRRELATLRAAISDDDRRAVDPAGDKHVRRQVADADRMLREGTLAHAMEALLRAEAAERAFQRAFPERRALRRQVHELSMELRTLEASAGAKTWCRGELADVARSLRAVANDGPHSADVDEIRERLDAIGELAKERALKHEQRRVVVDAARAAFEDLGFTTADRRPDDPAMDWVIEAKHEQGSLEIQLPVDGDLRYVPSESLLRIEDGKRPVAGCRDFVQLLDRWRAQMEARDVTVGAVYWNDEQSEPQAGRRNTMNVAQRGAPSLTRKAP